jgi:4-hydroxy-tetrahydrodipicolinate synthase
MFLMKYGAKIDERNEERREDMSKFQGAFVAIVTPFIDGKVDEEGLKSLIEFHIANGTHGIVPCGTTGESATMSHAEHHRVVQLTVETVAGRVPVMAGSGSNSTSEAIDLTMYAKKAGADAVLMVTPYYNRPSQEGLYQHYKAVAETVDIPIFLYNVPSRTGTNMLPSTVARCAAIDNIVGIKEATGSLNQVSELINLCPADFIVLSGDDFTAMPTVLIGGKGVISVTSNVAPGDMAAMMEAALAGKVARANELHYKLFPLMQAMFYDTNPVPAKKSLEMMGKIQSGMPRLPLASMDETIQVKLRKALAAYGLL